MIGIFYMICFLVALPLIILVCFRAVRHRLVGFSVAWGVACATYFLLLDLPYGVFWIGSFCGVLAGATTGTLYYFIVYAPISGNASPR
jgi:hypothetical protein